MVTNGPRAWSLLVCSLVLVYALGALAGAPPKEPPPPPKPGEPGTILFSATEPPKKFKNKKAREEAFAKSVTEFTANEDEEWNIHFHALLNGKAGTRNLQLWFIDITENPDNEKAKTIFQITAKPKSRTVIDKVMLDLEDWDADQKIKLRVMRVNQKKGRATVLAEGTFTLKGSGAL